jgi:hypothetical protein
MPRRSPPGTPVAYPPPLPYPPGQWTQPVRAPQSAPAKTAAKPRKKTNGLAIASLVFGLIGWAFVGVGSFLAIIFGLYARHQILRSGGRQRGNRLALAGILLGLLFFVIVFIRMLT